MIQVLQFFHVCGSYSEIFYFCWQAKELMILTLSEQHWSSYMKRVWFACSSFSLVSLFSDFPKKSLSRPERHTAQQSHAQGLSYFSYIGQLLA